MKDDAGALKIKDGSGKDVTLTALNRSWWKGETGRVWVDHNPLEAMATDESWLKTFGITKTDAIREIVGDRIPKKASWLEVGCSRGAHMSVIRGLGYGDLTGVDLCFEPLRDSDEGYVPVQGDVSNLPIKSRSFDVVTTSGVLMLTGGPAVGMKKAVEEIGRVSNEWMLVTEPWHEKPMICIHHLEDRNFPPTVVLPWDKYLTHHLTDFEIVNGGMWENLNNDPEKDTRLFPMSMVLMRRKQ